MSADSASAAAAAAAAAVPAQTAHTNEQMHAPLMNDAHTADGVAPPQLFASPFLPEHDRAIVTMMHADHPSLTLARSTVTLLQRFSDRLAHYLIDRAYHGLNGGMQDKLDAVLCDTEETAESTSSASGSSSSSSSVPFDRHAILFTFDEPTWSGIGSLRKFAHSAGIKAQTAFEELGQAGIEAVAGKRKSCMLSLAHADRWLSDFTAGLRLTDESATLPASLHSTDQRVVLCATVEYLLEELLEQTGNETNEKSETTVRPLHLATAVENDGELRRLCVFLPVEWSIDTTGIESHLQLACASHPLDAAHHATRVLQFTVSLNSAAQAQLNRGSWYQDSAAVIEAARMAARGELIEASISRQLRDAHVRPIRFWGVRDSLDDQPLVRAILRAGTFEFMQLDAFNREHAFVSFDLTDASGRVFQMLLVGERDASPRVLCFVSLPDRSFDLCLSIGKGEQVRFAAYTGPRVDESPPLLHEYRAHADAPESEHSANAAASSAVQEPDQSTSTCAEVEHAFRTAMPLLRFSLFGPTLYSDNHPPPMRRLFTAHLIDECMLATGLTPLPLVLSEPIADYHSFELPFREDKAAEQTSRAGLQPREQDPQKATYEGQLDSAIERVCDPEIDLDVRFPVAPVAAEE